MQCSKLYVGNLNYTVTDSELEELFAGHGTVKHVRIIEGKGFGFVEMETNEEAEKAMNELNGTVFRGRTMKIDEARPPKNKQKRPFRKFQNKE